LLFLISSISQLSERTFGCNISFQHYFFSSLIKVLSGGLKIDTPVRK